MFPIKDNIASKKFPFIIILLILVNIYVFFREITAPDPKIYISQYALIPAHVSFTTPVSFIPFITALFLHGGFIHIISNLWFLWIFGDNVEDYFGKFRFLVLYFLTGIIGNVAQYMLAPSSTIPIIGASGAISGILGAYFVLFPGAKIKSLIFIFFFVTLINIPAFLYLLYWFIIQLFSGASSLGNFQGGVAFWAHIGGFVAGYLFAKRFKGADKDFIEGEIVA